MESVVPNLILIKSHSLMPGLQTWPVWCFLTCFSISGILKVAAHNFSCKGPITFSFHCSTAESRLWLSWQSHTKYCLLNLIQTLIQTLHASAILLCFCQTYMYVSVKSKLQHPPPPPRAFDVFSCPGGGNLINLIFSGVGIWSLLIGGGEFDR